MVDEVRPGQLISSTQGRDAGRYYLVLSSSDDGFVLVSDGEYRGIEKPKRKNLKHVKVWSVASEAVETKLAEQNKVTNADIRSYLAELINLIQEEPSLRGKEVG